MSSRRFREICIESDFVLVHLTSRLPVGQCLWHMCNDPELLEHPQSVPYIPAFYDLLARQSMNPDSGNLHLFTSRRDAHQFALMSSRASPSSQQSISGIDHFLA